MPAPVAWKMHLTSERRALLDELTEASGAESTTLAVLDACRAQLDRLRRPRVVQLETFDGDSVTVRSRDPLDLVVHEVGTARDTPMYEVSIGGGFYSVGAEEAERLLALLSVT